MLLIQFELGGSNRADKRLIEAIGALGATARLMRSTFLVDSLLNAQQAYGVLEDLIEKGTDRMLVIEVNPRHVRYYERMLGFRVIAPARMNRSVNAPAVLLVADFSSIVRQIGEFGGQPDRAADERSLYPFFFSIPEEAGILSKLLAAQKTGSTAVN